MLNQSRWSISSETNLFIYLATTPALRKEVHVVEHKEEETHIHFSQDQDGDDDVVYKVGTIDDYEHNLVVKRLMLS